MRAGSSSLKVAVLIVNITPCIVCDNLYNIPTRFVFYYIRKYTGFVIVIRDRVRHPDRVGHPAVLGPTEYGTLPYSVGASANQYFPGNSYGNDSCAI